MFDKLFKEPRAATRHKSAPYAQERERYLEYYAQRGCSPATLHIFAAELLRIVSRLSKYPELRVTPKQIEQIANRYIGRQKNRLRVRHGRESRRSFRLIAMNWLRFLGRLREPSPKPDPFPGLVNGFARWMKDERGLSPQTIIMQSQVVRQFLFWYETRGRPFSQVHITDVDAFLAANGAEAWSRPTVALRASVLRAFFRYARMRQGCSSLIADAIQRPRVFSQENIPMGPTWEEVKRLLTSMETDRPRDIRNRAMIMLFAVYGLRSGEVAHLRLEDIDWKHDQILVHRSKRQGFQIYPLVPSVGNAILRYLQKVRPQSSCREIFLRLRPPWQPLCRGGLFHLTDQSMARLGIRPPHRGPHSLRHACATHLLAEKFSLKEIGDLLGHRRPATTQVYAKVDLVGLREVAAFDLGGVL